jgi:DnaK suppressor protein
MAMDDDRARELLATERRRVQALLEETTAAGQSEREASLETGDIADSAPSLVSEGTDDAIAAGLRDRLDALDRAEERRRAGTYGRSVRSGVPIPDERLEADPAAELTVEEAQAER